MIKGGKWENLYIYVHLYMWAWNETTEETATREETKKRGNEKNGINLNL